VSALDRDLARKIGLERGTSVTAEGSGGTDEAELVDGVSLELGGIALKDLTVAVLDLAPIAKALGRPIPAILGMDFFSHAVVTLDFGRNMMALAPADRFKVPAAAVEVTLKREDGLFLMPLSIDGLPAVEAALDIGNGGALSISKEYADANPVLGAHPAARGMMGGIGGFHETRRATLGSVALAGFTFKGVPADFRTVPGGPYEGRVNAGIELLKPFDVTLDLGHSRMWLRPSGRSPLFQKDRAGIFALLENDRLDVLQVSPGSPAARAGVKAGDSIRAIDRIAVTSDFYRSSLWSWALRPTGSSVELRLAVGRRVTLRLADYY
jgi:hypothetical protein